MTLQRSVHDDTLAGLKALCSDARLSAKAQASCAALAGKLAAPVRIGLLGLPGAGKRAILAALGGLPPDLGTQPLPTLELNHGPTARTDAMLADGSRIETEGLPTPDLLAQDPVFLQITSPAPALSGRSLLLLVTDASASDLRAGLAWAAPRLDLALWCSRDWGDFERDLWQAAPDRMHNHALLVLTGDHPARPQDTEFDGQFQVSPATALGLAPLVAHLDRVIEDASLQDIHAAQMLLHRYGAPAPRIVLAEQTQPAEIIPHPATLPPEAARDLARVFHAVRDAANDLSATLESGCDEDTLFTAFEETFSTLSSRAASADSLQEHLPDLAALFDEAQDLALLLRIEGGTDQLADAAQLLLQVRQDVEQHMAA
ncbi:hypothetical protein KZZ07_24070 [Mameliella sp. CS4]|uniref:hypothetical protein n=1 Tax=Mameliella sp. CS4 TaxID=2862329 RepID=UPI001C5CC6C4|nr:hypothetical protein [Mameliella sp. CS4]MBW4985623.1 hypothetical protein [Mameliella sp. CS4]